ncbi:hypothetical protein HHK36_014015 [Tetracentron sinense]|uniref:F-box domain-containing protein n=1 Tax=Tetracentron sinense TaxID=13715 RepID=A0A834Z5A4_TETSI|nr:hypothetical protein HHK36_014015 [Tetracentron sinense]
MDGCRHLTSNAVGFCLLPSELIQEILLRLALPEILRLKSVCKTLASIISGDYFRREYNTRSSSENWLFLFKKRSLRDSEIHGFTDSSDRWFKIPVTEFLFPVVPPGEDLYFLTASGDIFLFALNKLREVIAVNVKTKTVKKIPPSPLGPRDTSSWRRSGLKLIAGPSSSDHFRFLFTELHENQPVLLEYISETDRWQYSEAREINESEARVGESESVFLSVINRRSESVVIAVQSESTIPVVLRPRLTETRDGGDLLHVYGDGKMVIVRSEGVEGNGRVRVITRIEVLGLSSDGRGWEFLSWVPPELVDKFKKPYGVMKGCLEDRDGIIRVVLVSNHEGYWDFIWLSYELGSRVWKWVPLPDCRMKGSNMAGISLSSGPTL